LLQNLAQDIRTDVREDAHVTLNNIVATYAAIGVTITITGKLPEEKETANAFVSIIREAATNSVRHSHANLIQIVMTRQKANNICKRQITALPLAGQFILAPGLNGIKHRAEN